MSPVTSGSLTVIGSFGALLMWPPLSPLLRRFGFAVVLIGSAVVGFAAVAGFALIDADTPHWIIGAYAGETHIVTPERFDQVLLLTAISR